MTSSSKPTRNVPPSGGTPKASAYARFIPREELCSFAAWSPDALSGAIEENRVVQNERTLVRRK